MALAIHNLSRYPTGEVESLVYDAFAGFDAPKHSITVIVTNTRPGKRRKHGVGFSGRAAERGRHSIPAKWRRLMKDRRYLVRVRIGRPEAFPIRPYKRHEIHDYLTWQEAVVGVSAHEFKHIQDYCDGNYDSPERGCEAVERHVLLRWRAEHGVDTPDPGPLVAPWREVVEHTGPTLEQLSCGHTFYLGEKWDDIQEAFVPAKPHAKKRRCHYCLKEARDERAA